MAIRSVWGVFLGVGIVACGGTVSDVVDDPDAAAGSGGNAASGGSESGGDAGENGGGGGTGAAGGSGGGPGGSGGAQAIPERHRAVGVTCGGGPGSLNKPAPGPDAGGVPIGSCLVDADCREGLNGRCVMGRWASCEYDGCFGDVDCPQGTLCECGSPQGIGHRCLPAGCRTDADCAGSYCSPTFGMCGNYTGTIGYYCHTAEDECTDDSDCGGNGQWGGSYCMYEPQVGHWLCADSHCVG